MSNPIVIGVTGGSGAPYAVRLLEVLLEQRRKVHLVVSPSGAEVLRQEMGLKVDPPSWGFFLTDRKWFLFDGRHGDLSLFWDDSQRCGAWFRI